MMAVNGWAAGCDKVPLRTDKRKPSAEAMVRMSLSTITSTPINTGRASSTEAAKTTCEIISLKSATFKRMAPSMSGTGRGGNSWASIHLISVFEGPQCTFNVWVDVFRFRLTCSAGRVPTRSEKVRAGTVVEPSSSILAPIQQVMPSSRLVADRRIRPSSLAIRTFESTGRVLRGETARETVLNPRARLSCKMVTFMAQSSPW